jgi:hypothetical protein
LTWDLETPFLQKRLKTPKTDPLVHIFQTIKLFATSPPLSAVFPAHKNNRHLLAWKGVNGRLAVQRPNANGRRFKNGMDDEGGSCIQQ